MAVPFCKFEVAATSTWDLMGSERLIRCSKRHGSNMGESLVILPYTFLSFYLEQQCS
jgi:hypothetical protein